MMRACRRLAAVGETRPVSSMRRRMLTVSTRTNSGPASPPTAIAASDHVPSGPVSTTAAARTEASRTAFTSGPRRERPEWRMSECACRRSACARELPRAIPQWTVERQSVSVRSEETPAWTGRSGPRVPLARSSPRGPSRKYLITKAFRPDSECCPLGTRARVPWFASAAEWDPSAGSGAVPWDRSASGTGGGCGSRVLTVWTLSEDVLQPELDDSRAPCARDPAEPPVHLGPLWATQINVVEHIEKLSAKLKPVSF